MPKPPRYYNIWFIFEKNGYISELDILLIFEAIKKN
jgi:hypothetical protein